MNSTLTSGQQCLTVMNRPGHLLPVHLGHLRVHQSEVRLEILREGGGLKPAGGDGGHLDVWLGAKDAPEAVAGLRAVVDDEHPDSIHARPPLH